jgi:hypothetical protein
MHRGPFLQVLLVLPFVVAHCAPATSPGSHMGPSDTSDAAAMLDLVPLDKASVDLALHTEVPAEQSSDLPVEHPPEAAPDFLDTVPEADGFPTTEPLDTADEPMDTATVEDSGVETNDSSYEESNDLDACSDTSCGDRECGVSPCGAPCGDCAPSHACLLGTCITQEWSQDYECLPAATSSPGCDCTQPDASSACGLPDFDQAPFHGAIPFSIGETPFDDLLIANVYVSEPWDMCACHHARGVRLYLIDLKTLSACLIKRDATYRDGCMSYAPTDNVVAFIIEGPGDTPGAHVIFNNQNLGPNTLLGYHFPTWSNACDAQSEPVSDFLSYREYGQAPVPIPLLF